MKIGSVAYCLVKRDDGFIDNRLPAAVPTCASVECLKKTAENMEGSLRYGVLSHA